MAGRKLFLEITYPEGEGWERFVDDEQLMIASEIKYNLSKFRKYQNDPGIQVKVLPSKKVENIITKQQLVEWADKYETSDFIINDPIQFPRHYFRSEINFRFVNIEISAFVTAWISYGNRKSIIKKALEIDEEIFNQDPHSYIKNREWEKYENDPTNFYRFYTYGDFYNLCDKLYDLYSEYGNMRTFIWDMSDRCSPLTSLCLYFGDVKGISDAGNNSACKKLCMFLRWMIRKGPVDIGLWDNIEPKYLIIPIDTHVHKQALKLGITKRKTVDMKTAEEITEYFRTIWENDPCRGDFALFGYGVNNK